MRRTVELLGMILVLLLAGKMQGGHNCQGGAQREDRPGLAYEYGVQVARPSGA